jgi:hypothetical protein
LVGCRSGLRPDTPYGLLKSVFLTRKPRQEKASEATRPRAPRQVRDCIDA